MLVLLAVSLNFICLAHGNEAKPARIVTAKVVIPDCDQGVLIPTQVSRQGATLDMLAHQERDDLASEVMSKKLFRDQCRSGKSAEKPL